MGLIEKSPHPVGREGPVESQDWYAQCFRAKSYADQPGHEVWITSATHIRGQDKAVLYYINATKSLGFQIHWAWQGLETVDQLLFLRQLAKLNDDADLVLIVTHTHIGRVRWICEWKGIRVKEFAVVYGISRPQESKTDPVLEKAFPIMQRVGILNLFLAYVRWRRASGIL